MSATRFTQLPSKEGRLGIVVAESKNLGKRLQTHFRGAYQYYLRLPFPRVHTEWYASRPYPLDSY